MPRPALSRSPRLLLGAGLGLALAIAGSILLRRIWRPPPDRNRVAVAVFVNRTGDPALEPLGSMAADWVTRGLTQAALVDVVDVGAILVQGRTREGAPTDPYQLARRNGAGTVVAGSYYLATDTLVVRATIEDAVAGTVLHTVTPVHVPASQAVRALDRLREQVLVALGGVFDVRYSPFTARPSAPRSFESYQAFVTGQEAYWQGRPLPEVRALFERAASADSSFLASQVWLAFVGANGVGCGLTDSISSALQSRRAELTDFDRLTLDISAARCRQDWGGAFELARRQAGLRPRSTYAIYTAGFFGLTTGHFREAYALLRAIDPASDLGWLSDSAKTVYWRDCTGAAHLLGRYEEELADAERLVREFPGRVAPRLFAARALAALGRSADALSHVRAIQGLETDRTAHMSVSAEPGGAAYTIATELRVHGDSLAARAAAQMAVEWFRGGEGRLEGHYHRLQLARAQALLGDYDGALATVALGSEATASDPHYLNLRGWLVAKQGRREAAREIEVRLAVMGEAMPVLSATSRARIADGLGERERAIELLEGASRRGLVRTAAGNDMHADPLYDGLRGDPRFERLVRGE